MKLISFPNVFELTYCLRKRTIMQRQKDGTFAEIGKARGVLVKREHGGQTWYHRPEDYLDWKPCLYWKQKDRNKKWWKEEAE